MMDRTRSEIRDALAAEYALGTLYGGARRRFERWLAADRDLRRRVAYWERILATGAAEEVASVVPPRSVWRAVQGRLPGRTQWRPRGGWTAAAALVMVLVGTWALAPEPQARHKVVVTAPDGRTLWEVRAAGEQLRVRTVTDPGMAPQRQCRLWLRWEEAGHYQPVAVLAEEPGRHRMPMPEGLRGRLGDSQVLVSVTPSGQAAGERPQGRVIFRGSWARL